MVVQCRCKALLILMAQTPLSVALAEVAGKRRVANSIGLKILILGVFLKLEKQNHKAFERVVRLQSEEVPSIPMLGMLESEIQSDIAVRATPFMSRTQKVHRHQVSRKKALCRVKALLDRRIDAKIAQLTR